MKGKIARARICQDIRPRMSADRLKRVARRGTLVALVDGQERTCVVLEALTRQAPNLRDRLTVLMNAALG